MVLSDVYAGETYNASRVTVGYDAPRFNDSGWANCTVGGNPHDVTRHPWDHPSVIATHAPLPQIAVTGSAAVIDYWEAAPNSWVFDFGVNRAGVTTLTIPGEVAAKLGKGAVFTQQAAEALRCAKPCGINHYPSSGAANALELAVYISDPASKKNGVIFFGRVFFLISLGSPHVLRDHGAHVRGAKRNRVDRRLRIILPPLPDPQRRRVQQPRYASRAVQFHPNGGQSDSISFGSPHVRPMGRTCR